MNTERKTLQGGKTAQVDEPFPKIPIDFFPPDISVEWTDYIILSVK